MSDIQKPVMKVPPAVAKKLNTQRSPVAQAVGSTLPPAETPNPFLDALNASEAEHQTWEKLIDFGNSVGQAFLTMVDSINESVNMVKAYGCDAVNEFEVLTNATNRDVVKFSADFNKIQARHAGKAGRVTEAEELRLLLSIFEDYNSFNTYLHGTFHHTLISFTDFALQARDRMLKVQAELEAQHATELPQVNQDAQNND